MWVFMRRLRTLWLSSRVSKEKSFSWRTLNIFKLLKYAKEIITPAYRRSMDDFLVAAQGADIILYHPKVLGAVDIAERLNIPCICLPPTPIVYPIAEFPNFIVSAQRNFGPFLNRLSYKATTLGELSYIKTINDFRVKSLNLPKRKAGAIAFEVNGKNIPIIYPISPYLFEEVKSWEGRVYLSGFFYGDR